MPSYEKIELDLKSGLRDRGFIKEDEYNFSKSVECNKCYTLRFIFPADDGDLFMQLSFDDQEEKYALCYISLNAEKEKYLKKVTGHLFEKVGVASSKEIIDEFF